MSLARACLMLPIAAAFACSAPGQEAKKGSPGAVTDHVPTRLAEPEPANAKDPAAPARKKAAGRKAKRPARRAKAKPPGQGDAAKPPRRPAESTGRGQT